MQENAIYVHISIFKNRVLLNPKGMPHSQFTHLTTIEKSSVSSNSWLVLHIHQQEIFRTNWFNEPNRTPPIHHWSISKKKSLVCVGRRFIRKIFSTTILVNFLVNVKKTTTTSTPGLFSVDLPKKKQLNKNKQRRTGVHPQLHLAWSQVAHAHDVYGCSWRGLRCGFLRRVCSWDLMALMNCYVSAEQTNSEWKPLKGHSWLFVCIMKL